MGFLRSERSGPGCGKRREARRTDYLRLSENRGRFGDVLWFLAELCDVYGWDMDDIAEANIQKLRNRYPVKFTPEQSINRAENKPKREPVRSKY